MSRQIFQIFFPFNGEFRSNFWDFPIYGWTIILMSRFRLSVWINASKPFNNNGNIQSTLINSIAKCTGHSDVNKIKFIQNKVCCWTPCSSRWFAKKFNNKYKQCCGNVTLGQSLSWLIILKTSIPEYLLVRVYYIYIYNISYIPIPLNSALLEIIRTVNWTLSTLCLIGLITKCCYGLKVILM